MASISLRGYIREIEILIDQGHVDEAIAHSMHILKYVPKHIGTYRMLGKALHEAQRYADAADVFQRVLSSVPDDFVANVGTSIIRQDENNLDAAIWHMERAFEAQPSNQAIQEELRRLYGRRDGMEPPRVRLTRGALARMYLRGHLFHQAIAELRAALAEDPQRTDLQVLLAQACYQAGQTVESLEVCSQILRKYPFNLEANRLLALILPGTERAEDADTYRQRVISMEPYYQKAEPSAMNSDQVPDNAVVLEKLDYRAGQEPAAGPAQPSWAASLGVAFEEQKESEVPGWLEEASEETLLEGGQEEQPELPESFEMPNISWETSTRSLGTDWLKHSKEGAEEGAVEIEPAVASEEEPSAEPASSEQIPDWMKQAGWESSDGSASETPVIWEDAEPTPTSAEISQGEVPDWLKDMAPEGALDENAQTEAGEVPTWLQESPPGASDSVVSWLADNKEEKSGEELSAFEAVLDKASTEKDVVPEDEQDIPDWMKLTEGTTATTDLEIPAWLQDMEGVKPAREPEPTEPHAAEPEADLSDATLIASAAAAAASVEVPDWLKSLEPEGEAETPVPPVAEELDQSLEAPISSEVPADWVKGLETAAQAEVPVEPMPAESDQTLIAPPIEAEVTASASGPEVDAEMPDWLKGLEPEPEIEPVAAEPAVEAELPDWIKSVEPEPPVVDDSDQTLIASAAAVAAEAPDWLKGLEPEIKEELEASAEPIEEAVDQTLIAQSTELTEAVSDMPAVEAEIPDWLQAVEPGIEAEAMAAGSELADQVEPTPDAEMPDWLKPLEQEPGIEAEAPAEAVAESADQTLIAPAGVLAEESIAAEEPATEAEIPDWLKVLEPAAETDAELTAPVADAEPATEAELPDWLKALEPEAEIQAGVDVPVDAQLPTTSEEPAVATELPDWLAQSEPASEGPVEPDVEISSMETIVSMKPQLEQPVGNPPETVVEAAAESGLVNEDDALAFLASLAAKHEGDQEWLQGVVAETMGEDASIHAGSLTPSQTTAQVQPETGVEIPIEPVAEAVPVIEASETTPEEEVPDWLKDMGPEPAVIEEDTAKSLSRAAAEAVEEPPTTEPSEVPEWLKGIEPEPAITEEDTAKTAAESVESTSQESVTEEPEPAEAQLPDWLSSTEATAEELPTAQPVEAEIPDWLKGEGLPAPVESAAVADESVEPQSEFELEAKPVIDQSSMETLIPLQPSETPEEAAPVEAGLPQEAEAGLVNEDDALAFLASLAAKHEGDQEWLQSVVSETMGEDASVLAGQPEPPAAVVEPEPVAVEPEPAVDAELPDWLKQAATEEIPSVEAEAGDAVLEPEPAVEAELPDWLKQAAAEEEPVTDGAVEPVSDIESEAESALDQPAMETVISMQPPSEPDTTSLGEGGLAVEAEAGLVDEDDALAFLASLAAKHEGDQEWLQSVVTETMGEDSSVYTARQTKELPSDEIQPEEPPVEPVTQPEIPPAEQEALAWMESLAAKQGAPSDQLSTPAEERPEEPPEWVVEGKLEEQDTVPAAPSDEEIPGWLKEAAAGDTTQVQSPAAPEEDLWISQQPTEVSHPAMDATWTPSHTGKPRPPTGPLYTPSGKIDLNAASLSQLEHLPGVGFIMAQSIIAYRDVNGPFSSVEELADVPGVGREFAEELSSYLDVVLAAPTVAVPSTQAPIAPRATDDQTLLGARQAVIENDLPQAVESYTSLISENSHLDEVIQDLKDVLNRVPKDFNLWQTLGDAYLRKDQLQDALDAYSRAEELLR